MPNQKTQQPPINIQGLILVILATVCWSTSGIFINRIITGSEISPIGLAFWRDLSTFLCLLVGIAIVRPAYLSVKRRDVPWLLAMGAISIGSFHVMWNTAVMRVGASISTVLQCNAPIFVTLMAWKLFDEPLTGRKIAAVVLAALGIIFISGIRGTGGMQVTTVGIIIALGSAITYGSFSLFGKKLTGDYNSWTILLYVFGFATLILLPLQFGQPAPWPLPGNMVIFFIALVLFTTITGFGLYTKGLGKLQASIASITSTTEVVFAGVLAYIFLGERLDTWQIIGSFLIVAGVILVSLTNKKKKNSTSPQYS